MGARRHAPFRRPELRLHPRSRPAPLARRVLGVCGSSIALAARGNGCRIDSPLGTRARAGDEFGRPTAKAASRLVRAIGERCTGTRGSGCRRRSLCVVRGPGDARRSRWRKSDGLRRVDDARVGTGPGAVPPAGRVDRARGRGEDRVGRLAGGGWVRNGRSNWWGGLRCGGRARRDRPRHERRPETVTLPNCAPCPLAQGNRNGQRSGGCDWAGGPRRDHRGGVACRRLRVGCVPARRDAWAGAAVLCRRDLNGRVPRTESGARAGRPSHRCIHQAALAFGALLRRGCHGATRATQYGAAGGLRGRQSVSSVHRRGRCCICGRPALGKLLEGDQRLSRHPAGTGNCRRYGHPAVDCRCRGV